MTNNPIVITTTSDDKSELELIAKQLVDDRLAACCQIVGPMTSIYRWQDKIESSEEWMCLIKTQRSLFEAVASSIKNQHHYDEPEVIASEISMGSEGYLGWLKDNVSNP